MDVIRPYGKVQLEIDCYSRDNNILSFVEWKGKTQHGIQMDYDTLWRKKDSSFFVNGKEEGIVRFWDTTGFETGRINYKRGIRVGKEEGYYAPGKPEVIKFYDKNGKEHGSWKEWWPNGNPRKDLTLNHGQLQRSLEFFPNGKPRVQYEVRFRKLNELEYARRVPTMETWAPDGRSSGKVRGGKGETLIFQLEEDKLVKEVVHETYRDSVVVDVEVLDTTQAYQRLDSLARLPGIPGQKK
jgi:antitoxin component YwqK of YwqJK toxin-antitoxin module